MAEVAALHEVVLDDREVLLDEGGKRRALAVRAQLHSSIQRVGILRRLRHWHAAELSARQTYQHKTDQR